MDRLTIERHLPGGMFTTLRPGEGRKLRAISPEAIYRRLQHYEDTGLTPEEIIALIADNKRLHELVDIIEGVVEVL